ncbi:Qat anti-phage system QueC-like protein QatC [Rhizobium sp. BR 314]|uniref:Qat anti-phage system QueC-like protein QatC n=1 Tax=Rhizobium sp. BR 314 TaxID=3040013 RepID=UPI0039BEDAEE
MTVSHLKFRTEQLTVANAGRSGVLDVRLYGATALAGSAHIGNTVADQVQRLSANTTTVAFDLLSIALAVTAADSFIQRNALGENGWARDFDIELPLVNPNTWQPVKERLEHALHFLSGDTWNFTFLSGGRNRPSAMQTHKKRIANLAGVDCVSLFSGGLDSWIGVNNLLRNKRVPILVSHAYTGDRKYQNALFPTFKGRAERFAVNASPMRQFSGHDTTMRTRSFNFVAFAAVAAEAISELNRTSAKVPLYVPENGFIALNAPLTPRRVGTLSTRTTHPHYLSELQAIFDAVGIRAQLENPYRHKTKGQMLKDFSPGPSEIGAAMNTVSCGKWKRKGIQCGHCVPCIIRKSAFFAAGISDTTNYGWTLQQAIAHDNVHTKDDVMSMAFAVSPSKPTDLTKRALASGPLPLEAVERQGWFDVHHQGLYEVADYLRSEGVIS